MTLKIDSDDRGLTNVVQQTLNKVSPIKSVPSALDRNSSGNDSPDDTANSDHDVVNIEILGAKKLGSIVDEINNNAQVIQRELHFSIDVDSGKTVVKVMDLKTKEVIRQIPNEDALKFAQKLANGLKLQLINEYG